MVGCSNQDEKKDQPILTENKLDASEQMDANKQIQSLEDSLLRSPSNIEFLNEICYLYASKNDIRCLTYADKMISLTKVEKAVSMGHYNKGIYYSNTDKSDLAMAEFSKAIEEDYRNTDAYIEKAILLHDQKRYDESFSLLEKASIVDKYIATLYFWMAKNKQALGKTEEALYYYQQALELKPSKDETFESAEMIKKLKK